MSKNIIEQLSDREHLLKRPAMYIGGVDLVTFNEYINEDKHIIEKEVAYVPGLVKIINEIIDNSVDSAIKSNFKTCNEITVRITDTYVEVKDNGDGIPVLQDKKTNKWMPEIAWGNARAGSNFDDINRTQIGMNGIGSFATNCFSKKFTGISDDGKKRCTCTFKKNASEVNVKVSNSEERGVIVKFFPDLGRFGLDKIDDIHKEVIRQRLMNLNISFPEIKFKFNGKMLNINSFKKYVQLFNDKAEIYEDKLFSFAILPNENDDFRHFSFVNGLKIPDAGTHIDYISTEIVSRIKTKLQRKYDIKPGDIKNKLFIIAFLKDFPNPKFNSQSKEKITNSLAEIKKYFGEINFDKFVTKLLKNDAIIEPIVDVYKIKEELKKRREVQSLSKAKKKVVDKKYLPATSCNNILILCEGDSARGGISSVLGRENYGYIALRGLPLSSYSKSTLDVLKNPEMKLISDVLGMDLANDNYLEDGDWYELELDNGNKVIVNENDTIKIDDYLYDIKDLIKDE